MSKIYILNTKMTSSVYIKMMAGLDLPIPAFSDIRCILVTPDKLHSLVINKNADNFFICGREIQKEEVIQYIKYKFNIDPKDITVIDIPHVDDFDYIMQEHGFTKEIIKSLQNSFINTSYPDEYYEDLCYEFFYTFVKPLYPDLAKPKIQILEEMNGFLHIRNSIYKTVGDRIFECRFYKKPRIFDDKFERFFTVGFGGLNIFEYSVINLPKRKLNLFFSQRIDFNIYDRYINFLERSKCAFGLYYEDKSNTCYVIKQASKDLKEDFSYKINNRQYAYMDCINVPNWLYNTPSDKLDIKKILSVQNIDVRTLAIKKLGIENLIQYGKIIDSWENYPENEWWAKSEYQLIDMHDFVPPIKTISSRTKRVIKTEIVNYAPYLFMKNQTTGEYHLEGVSPDCKDLYDAIKMRYKGLNLPSYEIKNIK